MKYSEKRLAAASSTSSLPFIAAKISRNKLSFFFTFVAVLLISAIGTITLITSSAQPTKQATQATDQQTGGFAVNSLPLQDIKGSQSLQLGEAKNLAVNGQLHVNNTLTIAPSSAPSAPTAGQIYYDKTTNQPYYYDGTKFTSLVPAPESAHVSSLGGATGAIGLGNSLQISGNRLAVSGALLQSISSASPNTQVHAANGILYGNGSTAIQDTGAAANSILATDGNGTPGLTQSLPGAVQGSITSTGSLSGGAISGGFGSISTNSLISTTAALQGGSLSVAGNIKSGLNCSVLLNGGKVTTDASGNLICGGDSGGPGGSGANTALSNLASVAINTSLLSGSSAIDLGSSANPFRDLYLGGTTTNNFHFNGSATAARTLSLPDASGTICINTGNCAGAGGGIIGNGTITTGNIAKFSGAGSITNSSLSESGNTVTATGSVIIQGTNSLSLGTAGPGGNTGSIAFKNSTNANTVTLQSGASGSNFSLTLPTGTGTPNQCLVTDGSGVLSFNNCLSGAGGGGGGVISLNGNSGNLSIQGTANQVNVTSNGVNPIVLSLPQNIATSSSPTFAALTTTGNINGQTITNLANFTGTLNVQGASATIGNAAQQGSLILNDGNGASNKTGTLQTIGNLGQNTVYTLPDPGGASASICLSSGNCLGAGGGGANTALSNLASVAINTSLLSGSSAIDLGSSANPFRDLYLGGTTTNNFHFNGSATAARTLSLPDASGTICINTGNCAGAGGGIIGNGTITTGNIAKFSGAGSITNSSLSESGNTVTATGSVIIQGTNSLSLGTAGPGGNTGSIAFKNSTNANTVTLQSGASGSNFSLTLPTGTGTPNQCLVTDGSGVLSFNNCLSGAGGGGGGVISLNGNSGNLSIQGTANQVNVTSNGVNPIVLSLPQNIATSSSPTFAALTTTGNINGQTITNLANFTGTLNVQGASATIGNAAQQGSLILNDGNGASNKTGTLQTIGNLGQNTVYTLPDPGGASASICLSSGNCLGAGGGGANTALSNLASVAINTSLLSGSSAIDLGSSANPFRDLYLGGTTTNNFHFNGSATAARTLSLPDASGTICINTGNCAGAGGGIIGNGTITTGNIAKFSGAGSITNSSLSESGNTVTATGSVIIQGTNSLSLGTAGPGGNTGSIAFKNSTNANTVTLQSGASGSNFSLTLPTGTGTPNQCLVTDGSGVLSFNNCLSGAGGGGGGVISLNGNSGNLSIQGTANQVNVTSNGVNPIVLSLPQNIATSSSPTFAALTTTGNINGQTITNLANFTGTLNVQGASATIGNAAQQGSLILNDGNGASNKTGTLQTIGNLGQNTVYTLPDPGGASASICLSSGNCLGAGGGGANTALSNLASVAINTSLLSGSSAIDLGSSANPFRDLYLGGTTTNNFHFNGSATAARTLSLPDASGTICINTGNCAGAGGGIIGNGTITTGNIAKFSGAGSITNSSLSESGNTVTATGSVIIQGTNSLSLGTAGPGGNTGSIAFKNSTNANTVTLQSGASGSNFSLTLPTTKGNSGDCLQSDGTGALNFNICPGAGGSGVNSIGGIDSQTKSSNGAVIVGGTSLVLQTADAANPGLVSTGGQTFAGAKTFSGAVTIQGSTTLSALSSLGVVHNSAAGLLSTSAIVNADLQGGSFANITGVGTLTGGLNIAAAQTYKINGVDINTAGTLSNVAYLNQANNFTLANTFSGAGTGLTVTNAATIGTGLTVTTGNANISAGGISTSQTYTGTSGTMIGNQLFVNAAPTAAAPSANYYATQSFADYNATVAAATIIGTWAQARQLSGAGGSLTSAIGLYGQTALGGAGSVTNAIGVKGIVDNIASSSGSVTSIAAAVLASVSNHSTVAANFVNAMGLNVGTPTIDGNGTITNDYGIYIGSQSIAGVGSAYGIYQGGPADLNIFSGPVTFKGTGNGSSTTSVLIQNTGDSTTAFQIQNAAGTSNLFRADTQNNSIGVGAVPANSLLTVGTNTTTAAGGVTFGTDTVANLYRSNVGQIRTDGQLATGSDILAFSGNIVALAGGMTAQQTITNTSGVLNGSSLSVDYKASGASSINLVAASSSARTTSDASFSINSTGSLVGFTGYGLQQATASSNVLYNSYGIVGQSANSGVNAGLQSGSQIINGIGVLGESGIGGFATNTAYVSNAVGLQSLIFNNGPAGAQIGNAYGLKITTPNGIINNNYGVYIDAQQNGSIGTAYGLYQNGTDNNYLNGAMTTFNGNLRVGDVNNVGSANRLFSDGFEGGNFGLYPFVSNITINSSTVLSGKYSAKVAISGGTAYATNDNLIASPTIYARAYVNVASETNSINLFSVANGSPVAIYRDQATGKVCIAAVSLTCAATQVLPLNQWHKLELRVTAGNPGTIQAFYDDTLVLTDSAQNIGTNPFSQISIGETVAGRTATYYLDNLSVDTIATGTSANLNVSDSLHVAGTSTFNGAIFQGGAGNFAGAGGWYSGAPAVVYIGKESVSGRSINAAGAVGINGAADYAEYIPWVGAKPAQGSIVTYAGSHYVVSSETQAAIIAGSNLDPANSILVTYVGQVDVRVTGPVAVGDLLLDNGDGTAKAISPTVAHTSDFLAKIAIAQETNSSPGVNIIKGSVGSATANPSSNLQEQSATFGSLNVSGVTTLADLTVTGLATINNLAVTGTATIANLTVTGVAHVVDILVSGHVITAGGQPVATAQASSGSGAVTTVSGTDTAGTITITTGSAPTAGDLVQLTYAKAFGAVPRIVISGQDDASVSARVFPSSKSAASFTLKTAQTLAPNTTYTFDYFIAQ